MRAFGMLLWIVAIFVLLGGLVMDTSVPTEAGQRVHNIGLLRAQQNAVLIGVGLFIGGAIFLAIGGKPVRKETEQQRRKCPYCAELIKSEAKLCRFCGKDVPSVKSEPDPQLPPDVIQAPRVDLDKLYSRLFRWK